MRFVLTAQAWVVILRLGRPAAQTLGRYRGGKTNVQAETIKYIFRNKCLHIPLYWHLKRFFIVYTNEL